MASSVSPSWAVWSSPTDVTTHTAGSHTLVLSNRPPSPTSTTATPTRRRAKCRNPRAVPISKKLAGGCGSRSMSRTAAAMSARQAASSSPLTGTPSTCTRSSTRSRWGEVNSPTRWPAARSTAAAIAAVDPLPLVPVTWTTRYRRWGSPSRARRARIRSSLRSAGAAARTSKLMRPCQKARASG